MGGRLAGQVALVTGAARGIGDAIARAFVAEGATAWLTDLFEPDRIGGTPEEVAAMAVFLASDESAYVTGSEFNTDGGLLAGSAAVRATASCRRGSGRARAAA